ncbi:MAG TPA: hypothetical protein VGN06_02985 [Gaiellaceae bacterium]
MVVPLEQSQARRFNPELPGKVVFVQVWRNVLISFDTLLQQRVTDRSCETVRPLGALELAPLVPDERIFRKAA